MATSIQGTPGPIAPQARIEPDQRPDRPAERTAELATEFVIDDPPLLFINAQHEPLVHYPAAPAPWAPPRAAPGAVGQRAFDVALAILSLLLLWPVMLAAALCVRASGPGPIIFRHVRLGKDGAPFVCLKFRTMDNQAEELLGELLGACGTLRQEWQSSQKMRRDPRVTRVGQLLRRFSIDELPQLFNVLRGEMSIVGPRPIVEAEIDRYGAHFADYCRVKPGLTGLWQVSGRNCLSYERRVELDSHYAHHRSLGLDLAIVLLTVPVVLRGSGC
jgi:lipopolysaccharide/colanic/teichoic acid biosynthesis glycosyltransferase